MSELLISVHIPKTGGVTFREALVEAAGGKVAFDYADRPLAPASPWVQLRRRLARAATPLECNVVHGHFVASKYRHVRGARFLTWFRDPVERLVSHYHYWKREPDPENPLCVRLLEEKLSLEAFAAQPEMRNVHARFLGGIPVEQLAFVGLTERFDEGMELFRRLFFPDRELPLARSNVNPERTRDRYMLEPGLRERLDRLNAADRGLYGRASEHFEALRAGLG